MTTEEHAAMDIRVAVEVMGWKYDASTGMADTKTLHRVPATEMADVRLWRPSTDPAAAWFVVERMRELGWAVDIVSVDKRRDNPSPGWAVSLNRNQGESVTEIDDTMPLAVCRSAIAALGAKP